jgi:hypothetical protein
MARALTRTNLHSSNLIRVLADLAVLDAAAPGNAFAEKLGEWLNLNDAITLRALHTASPPARQAQAQPASAVSLQAVFDQTKAALVAAITQTGTPKGARTRLALPVLVSVMPLDGATAYEPYRRYHLAHQRQMDSRIGPMRAEVRQRLCQTSPALKSLADLDAVFEGILCDHEARLLARLPTLLEQRFGQLLTAHQQQLAEAQQTDQPALWMTPGGWLGRFCHELQTVLLAELDFRLQTTLGLVEALNHTTTPPQ